MLRITSLLSLINDVCSANILKLQSLFTTFCLTSSVIDEVVFTPNEFIAAHLLVEAHHELSSN